MELFEKDIYPLGDLGMFATSIASRGADLNSRAPQLVDHLVELSRVTGLPPRDTYYSYVYLNPGFLHSRMYFGSEDEIRMVGYNQSFKQCFGNIIGVVEALRKPSIIVDQTLAEKTQEAARNSGTIANLMLEVRENVSPQFFFDLRGLSKAINIGNNQWVNESGLPTSEVHRDDSADPNIMLLDALLYGIDQPHHEYLQRLFSHLPNSLKNRLEGLYQSDEESLAGRFTYFDNHPPIQADILMIFKNMWRWRSVHNSAVSTHLRKYEKVVLKKMKALNMIIGSIV